MITRLSASAAVVALTIAVAPLASAFAQSAGNRTPGMGPGGMGGPGMNNNMMRGGMGQQPMMMQRMMMMMRGMMGHGFGPRIIYGTGPGSSPALTVSDVKTYLGRLLQWHGNKRLKLGKVTQTDTKTIVAEIVTVDNSLVQKLSFDRQSRIARQVN